MHARLAVARRELPRAVRIAIAATLAWWVARLLGADRPVFAVIVLMVAIRDDLQDQWSEAALRLPPIIGLVAAAASKALAGEGCAQEVASARELLADFQREDTRPVSAILRRPLVLLLDELAGPPA
jgi:hypothetical protein